MANHPYNNHREQQVAHRRVGTILSGSPAGAEKHAKGHAFSKLTSKSAAVRDNDISGRKSPQRFARGGKVKHGGNTNIAIVLPKGGGPAPGGPAATPLPMAGPGGPPPMGAPPPGMPPGPPGMPMRARGGRIKKADGGPVSMPLKRFNEEQARQTREELERRGIVTPSKARGGSIDGEATKGDIKKWGNRAKGNSYFTGGAVTGVGREEKAERMERRRGEKT